MTSSPSFFNQPSRDPQEDLSPLATHSWWWTLTAMLMVFWVFNLVGEYRIRWTRPQGVPPITSTVLTNQGGLFGPIQVPHDRMVYKITLNKEMPAAFSDTSWSQLEAEILDEEKETLLTFGDEVFRQQEYDEGSLSVESKSDVPLDVTFPKKGNYFVKVSVPEGVDAPTAEGNSLTQALASTGLATAPVNVTAVPRVGSALPYQVLGWFSFLGMLATGFIAAAVSGAIQNAIDSGVEEYAAEHLPSTPPKQPPSFGRSWMD